MFLPLVQHSILCGKGGESKYYCPMEENSITTSWILMEWNCTDVEAIWGAPRGYGGKAAVCGLEGCWHQEGAARRQNTDPWPCCQGHWPRPRSPRYPRYINTFLHLQNLQHHDTVIVIELDSVIRLLEDAEAWIKVLKICRNGYSLYFCWFIHMNWNTMFNDRASVLRVRCQ